MLTLVVVHQFFGSSTGALNIAFGVYFEQREMFAREWLMCYFVGMVTSYDVTYFPTDPYPGQAWQNVGLTPDGTKVVAMVNNARIYVSSDSGSTWSMDTSVGIQSWNGVAMSADGTRMAAISRDRGVYLSTDGGATWAADTRVTTSDPFLSSWNGVGMSSDGLTIAVAGYGSGIWISIDGGANWAEDSSAGSQDWQALAMSADGTMMVAAVHDGNIWRSTDTGSTWVEESGGRVWGGGGGGRFRYHGKRMYPSTETWYTQTYL